MTKVRLNLKNARKEKGMTQQQVADYLHISLRHYQFIEQNKRVGSVDIWDMLEDLFNIHQRTLRQDAHNYHDQKDSQ